MKFSILFTGWIIALLWEILMLYPLCSSPNWLSANLVCDHMPWVLIVMSLLVILPSGYFVDRKTVMAPMLLLVLSVSFFLSDSLLLFYVSFELVLIPITWILVVEGYQPERQPAAVSMFFYTVSTSLLLFVNLLYMLQGEVASLHLMTLESAFLKTGSVFAAFTLISAFLVKIPTYGAHLWLPKAHVEASVKGSMILAGILLKLGGFGLMQVFPPTLGSAVLAPLLFYCLLGGCVGALICMRQVDMKLVVAFSSVVHMSAVASLIFTGTPWGFKAATLVMVTHAFSSSWMFFMVNLTYVRSNSRNILLSGGLSSALGGFFGFWFLSVVSFVGGPPTVSLWGELVAVMGLLVCAWSSFFPLAAILFLGVGYGLILFSGVSHSRVKKAPHPSLKVMTSGELMSCVFLAAVTTVSFMGISLVFWTCGVMNT